MLGAREIKAKREEYMDVLAQLQASPRHKAFYKSYIETLGYEIETGQFNTYQFVENCDRAINTMWALTNYFKKNQQKPYHKAE